MCEVMSLLFLYITLSMIIINSSVEWPDPTPILWPEQFHALIFTKLESGSHQITDFWYDWPKGRNVYLEQKQLGVYMYDVEWKNGTSFYFTKGTNGTCDTIDFGIGIPRPDFLDGAHYLGTRLVDGFLCNAWEKVDFIWYYEDVATKTPVRWDFFDGIITHVMTFKVGATLPDSIVQAPHYCFSTTTDKKDV